MHVSSQTHCLWKGPNLELEPVREAGQSAEVKEHGQLRLMRISWVWVMRALNLGEVWREDINISGNRKIVLMKIQRSRNSHLQHERARVI